MKEMFIRFFYCKNTNNLLNFSIQPPHAPQKIIAKPILPSRT